VNRCFGPAPKPHLFKKRFHFKSNLTNVFPANAWTRIEIDAQLVRVLEVTRTHGVRMQLNATQVHDPGESRRIIDYDFLSLAPGRE